LISKFWMRPLFQTLLYFCNICAQHIKDAGSCGRAVNSFLPPDQVHRDPLVETACRLCSCSIMRIIYCCPIQLGGEFSNYTGCLPLYSFPLPIPSSLPFSMPVLGECQILTLEAPLITGKAPCMYNGYI
jgi:hypothetical protein